MSMKLQDLHKNKMLKAGNAMKHTGTPDRFSKASPTLDRKEQRKLDQAAGLVPFACKLPIALITALNERAKEDDISLNELVANVLASGLEKPKTKSKAAK